MQPKQKQGKMEKCGVVQKNVIFGTYLIQFL